MNKSVTSRNLTGGFLGGAFGILISWYVAPPALPLGVLVGVIVGWWAEDIAQAFVNSFHTAVLFWRRLVAYSVPEKIRLTRYNFVKRFRALLALCIAKADSGISYTLGCMITPLHWVGVGARSAVSAFMCVARWVSHPSSTALLITISAIIVGAVINASAFSMLWPWPEMKTVGGIGHATPEHLVAFTPSEIVFITVIVTLFLTMFGLIGTIFEDAEESPVRNFYLRWERYSQHSPTAYFMQELYRFFRSEVMVMICITLMVAYWVTLGGVLIALVMIPVATFVTFMVGLYKIAQRSAHWWCFGVTLATTGISALVFYNSFGNEAVLWTVALCTGFVSGGVTEGLRRIGNWWSNTETGQHYLNIWYDENRTLPFSIAKPVWRTLCRVYENMFYRIRLAV